MQNSFRDIVIKDLNAVRIDISNSVSNIKLIKHVFYCLIYFPNFACVFWYRVNHLLFIRKLFFWKILNVLRFYWFKNDISVSAKIGPGLRLVHVTDIVIGSNVKIGDRVTIFNGVTLGARAINNDCGMPTIGDDVFFGTGAKIIGGITIGSRVIVGALAYCDKSIPDNSIAYGNPMKIKKNQRIRTDSSWKFIWDK